ncbi:hypothetical protein Tsubulata_002604, partial [Turnera subulata]
MVHKRWENTLIATKPLEAQGGSAGGGLGAKILLRALLQLLELLACNPWKPKFDLTNHKITSVVAWVQIPGLSCEYYDRLLLQTVSNLLGRMVQLDHNTQEAIQGCYARVALELDLSKPL